MIERELEKMKSPGENDSETSPIKLTIVTQYYVPDTASTGQLMHVMACELKKRNFDVSVLTSQPSYGPKDQLETRPSHDQIDDIPVRRVYTTRFSKDSLPGRVCNLSFFMGQILFRMLFLSRRDTIYLYVTNPPFSGALGWFTSLFRRHTYIVVLQDSYPEIIVWAGLAKKGGFIEGVWNWLNRAIYRRAASVGVLCKASKRLVVETYRASPEKVYVAPNCADGQFIRPKEKQDSEFAKEQELLDDFTLLYSGNLGICYDYETVLQVAHELREEPFQLVFVGNGGKRNWIEEQINERGLTNTRLLPYQPYSKIGDSLNGCDASLVTIAEGIEGVSFPSKLYASLAVGKPILLLAEPWSEIREMINEYDCGYFAEVGDVTTATEKIRQMMADREKCLEQGERARELFESEYTETRYGDRNAAMAFDVWEKHIKDGKKRR